MEATCNLYFQQKGLPITKGKGTVIKAIAVKEEEKRFIITGDDNLIYAYWKTDKEKVDIAFIERIQKEETAVYKTEKTIGEKTFRNVKPDLFSIKNKEFFE